MRGYLMKDGSRTAVTVQVHPDPRVQALVEQVREREIEQMVGRLRLVHRTRPARVFLLTNTPTALAVDRLTTWEGIMPDKMEQAIVRGRGALPLSSAELARVHPDLWATANEVDHWRKRKGSQVPIRVSYWNVATLSVATLVSYRRPGQRRGSPHRAIIPGDVYCPDTAALDLAPLLGAVEDVRLVETLHRPMDPPAPVTTLPAVPSPELDEADTLREPAPEPVQGHPRCQEVEVPPPLEPEPATWLLGKVPASERPYWREQLLQDRAQGERRLLRRAASLNVVQDASQLPPLILPNLRPAGRMRLPDMLHGAEAPGVRRACDSSSDGNCTEP
jgi:hypothetical protein